MKRHTQDAKESAMCWIGFVMGATVGATLGAVIMAAMNAAAKADRKTDDWYDSHDSHGG
jgi:uncharacterized membrane-anchored protein YhcB (DUF1043 family)